MKMRKFLSLVSAGALMLSIGAPAFAAGDEPNVTVAGEATEFSFSPATYTPSIKVCMNTSETLYVNPYGAALEVGQKDATTKAYSKATIGSPIQYIENYGDTPLKVGVQITPKYKSGITDVATDAITAAEESKKVELTFQLATYAKDAAKFAPAVAEATGKFTAPTSGKLATIDINAKDSDGNYTGRSFRMLDKATSGLQIAEKGSSNPGLAAFSMYGEITAEPKKQDPNDATKKIADKWSDSDSIEATVAFTFVPA